jgi:uncharacterized SAM-binding protein YcdF (DUF218 family)
LIYPTTIILVLLIAGLFLKKRALLIAATAIFLITSNPLISDQMMSYLEVGQLKKSVDDVKKADAIVVLSGMLTTIETTKGLDFEWSDPDRFFGGIELIRADKTPLLIFKHDRSKIFCAFESMPTCDYRYIFINALGYEVYVSLLEDFVKYEDPKFIT